MLSRKSVLETFNIIKQLLSEWMNERMNEYKLNVNASIDNYKYIILEYRFWIMSTYFSNKGIANALSSFLIRSLRRGNKSE